MTTLPDSGWRQIVEQSPEGIVICDATSPDYPVVYANASFLQLSGYALSALMGRNLRLLQGNDHDQEGRQRMRDALSRGEPCRVLMRNYQPDGAQYWNEILIQPVRDAQGKLARATLLQMTAAPAAGGARAQPTTITRQHVFARAHPVFDGHFPGHPIVPGAVLLAEIESLLDAHDYAVVGCDSAKL